jgi:hypothetical protein
MRQPKKSPTTLASLEALAKDDSMPLAVREQAGQELIRLTAQPTATAPVPVRVEDMSATTFATALSQIATPAPTQAPEKPKVVELNESQQWAAEAPEWKRRAEAAAAERDRVERKQIEANRPPTVEEYQAKRALEMRRAREEWTAAMGCPLYPEFGDWGK